TIKRPASADDVSLWRDGYAWLAGGTWLFSQPQPATDTLIDLEGMGWPALQVSPDGLDIAATCRIVELDRFVAPAEWIAAALLRSIHLPARALAKRFAFRRTSLTHLGRSSALLIGTRSAKAEDLLITVTAATVRPIALPFPRIPSAADLRAAIDAAIPESAY